MPNQNSFAQSTIEYLVIVGVVVVLSLVTVGVVTGFFGSASGVSADSSKLFWQSQPLGLSDAGADASGDTFFVVTNNTGEDITLLGYVANGVVRDFTSTTPLISRGDKKVVFIARQEACATGGSTCSLSNVSFKYRSANGLDKVSSGNDLVLEKQNNVSVAMFDSQPSTLICVNEGDVGQCGSGSSAVKSLLDLNNVLISTPLDGQALVYRSSDGNWVNSVVASGADTNWQTNFSLFDTNMRSNYLRTDTTNNPLTGNLDINKTLPTL